MKVNILYDTGGTDDAAQLNLAMVYVFIDLISLALWLIESSSVNMWVPEDPDECVDSPGEGFISTEPSCCCVLAVR